MNHDYSNTKGYLNTAGAGLISRASVQAGTNFIKNLHNSGSQAFFEWREHCLPNLFANAIQLLDAGEKEIAFPPNFSFALQGVISGIPRQSKILLIEGDYPSLTLPFELGKYNITRFGQAGTTEFQHELESYINSQSFDVLAVSHVQFKSGFTLDLDRLGAFCRERGIASIVDCTQSLGAIPISLKQSQIDVIIASNYKWMNSGFGSGIAAARSEFFNKYPSQFGGFGSFDFQDGRLKYAGGIRALEPGHQSYPSLSMLEVAISERLNMGVDAVFKHNAALDAFLAQGLETLGIQRLAKGNSGLQSSISVIACDELVGTGLAERGIVNTWREGHLRVAPHFYNDESDVQMLINGLEEIILEATVPESQLFPGRM